VIRQAVQAVAWLRSAHRPFQIEIARYKERNPAPRLAGGLSLKSGVAASHWLEPGDQLGLF